MGEQRATKKEATLPGNRRARPCARPASGARDRTPPAHARHRALPPSQASNSADASGCCPARRSAGQVKNGPTPSRANFLGSPRNRGSNGAPSRISGGATDISNRCCTMWAESSRPENASSGEAIASQSATRPPTKANERHAGNRVGKVRCKIEPTAQVQNEQHHHAQGDLRVERPRTKNRLRGR